MMWLPSHSDFRGSLRRAQGELTEDARATALTELARYSLSFVETIQLDNAVRALPSPPPGLIPIRLALLSSCTVDQLLPAIRVAGLRRGLHIQTYTGAYGQYRQELLDPGSELHRYKPHFVLLSLTAAEHIEGVPITASAADADGAIDDAVRDLRGLWKHAQGISDCVVIQQSLLDTTEPLFGALDLSVPGAPARLIARLNERLIQAAADDKIHVLDVSRASARDGLDAWFDVTRWLQGKLEISPQASTQFGEMVARLIASQRGLSRKCLVVDLDNTLWSGVIGDDGLDGIVIGQGSALGEAHLALQRYIKRLTERGIPVAVCSKNETKVAKSAFEKHPEMLLKLSDFAAFMANWTDKAENLRNIAKDLNIGLDSLVFVDDNPAERARVRSALPEVAVPELPRDPAHYVRCIASAGYFEAASFTAEDGKRTQLYAANAQRGNLREAAQSFEDYLRQLDMTVSYGRIASVDMTRSAQLLNKTNQFNTRTRRYSEQEISNIVADSSNIPLQFRLQDRFGDNGLVSVMLLSPRAGEAAVYSIDNWVMSCRVFGRQLEDEAMNIAVELLRRAGAVQLTAEYIPTKKNAVIKDLFENLGFSSSGAGSEPGATLWTLNLSDYRQRPTFIHHDHPSGIKHE